MNGCDKLIYEFIGEPENEKWENRLIELEIASGLRIYES